VNLKKQSQKPSLARKLFRSLTYAALGFVAVAVPLHVLLRRELRDAPEDIREQGWPIQVLQVLFDRYVLPWVDVEGLENLPQDCSYIVAANHGYRSGVDGFILGHLLATRAGRIPRILITADSRNWMVQIERWVLHNYGIALLVPDDKKGVHHGMSDIIASYLKEADNHAVLIFPAGRAIADPEKQLQKWSTGVVVSAEKSGCPVVPVAIGGLRLDWSPETVIFAGMDDEAKTPPFHIHVRIGEPLYPTDDPHLDLARLRESVAGLMDKIPGLRPLPGESDPAFGKLTLRDGRTLAYMDRGPHDGTPVLYFHGFQGSRLETTPGLEDILVRLNIRLISPDRPGIGLSTPIHGRTVVAWSQDVAELTEHLLGPGAPFSIFGFSAGATYALACGQLPGLRAMALVSGMGMPSLISHWAQYSKRTWRILLSAKLANISSGAFLEVEEEQHQKVLNKWGPYFDEVKISLSPDDQRLLSSQEAEELFQRNRREGYSQSPGSLLQEVQALYSEPEVDLEQLAACTVLITHGTDDPVIPIAVARDLHEHIPTSRLRELRGRGHYFVYETTELEAAFQDLVTAHLDCPRVKSEKGGSA
jgi:pimeloyl-ACP methyl ester carboxylesterase/1-acyl-sn-glycerol-3-phosphate acyltransferase